MTKEEMKNKYSNFITEISEILGSGKPIDILKLCATTDLFFQPLEKRIAELEAENEQIKNSDTLCKLIGEQTRKITELEAQIEKMKCCGNCIHCKYDENEESYEFCEKHQQVVNIAIVPCSEWELRR